MSENVQHMNADEASDRDWLHAELKPFSTLDEPHIRCRIQAAVNTALADWDDGSFDVDEVRLRFSATDAVWLKRDREIKEYASYQRWPDEFSGRRLYEFPEVFRHGLPPILYGCVVEISDDQPSGTARLSARKKPKEPERITLHNSRVESFTPAGMGFAPIGDVKSIEVEKFSSKVLGVELTAEQWVAIERAAWDTKIFNSWDWQKDCPRVQTVERREVIVRVSQDRIWALFEKFFLGMEPDWTYVCENPGIPKGTRVVSVHEDFASKSFCFTLAHPSFDPVPDGEPAPILSQKWNWKAVGVDPVGSGSLLVFNYPEGDEFARNAAKENAAKIKGHSVILCPKPPGGSWPAVEVIEESDVADPQAVAADRAEGDE